jgi:uncharacterized protein
MRTAMRAGQVGSAELADLVARGATVDLNLTVASLARLAALGVPGSASDAAALGAQGTFQSGPEGYPQLRLTVTGSVGLLCQRCLGELAWPVDLAVVLTLVRDDAEAVGLADPFETALLTDDGLDLAQVVEDEVLASLPLSPRHPETAACGRHGTMNSGETHRPMAGLADLLGRGGRQGDE